MSEFFYLALEAEQHSIITAESILKWLSPLLRANPTPLSRLCWSCQSVPTLHLAVITISNCSVCQMSLGLKLVVMTFSP